MKEKLAQCRRCILDSRTPGITINPHTGLCQWCEQGPLKTATEEANRILATTRGGGEVDAIFALSGGKDSCYTLYRLKEEYPDLRILAVQFDNGFIADSAVENAQQFCHKTGSTFLSLSLDPLLLQTVFRRAAESINAYPVAARIRASDICNTCIGIVKQKLIELALVHHAPLIVFAFSPGQTTSPFVRLSAVYLRWFRNMFQKELEAMGVKNNDELLIPPELIEAQGKREMIIVHPLLIWDYHKEQVEQAVVTMGWKRPELADKISTNCLLNAFANDNHIRKYGIHPYAFDLAALVREGRLSREEALRNVNMEQSQDLIQYAHEKLSIIRK
ncbi:MAG: hypothetical protein LUP99_02645 [Methanomicrobiales archaeon]|nr:hypothetical protein [Methanomicrobiales archaeon]